MTRPFRLATVGRKTVPFRLTPTSFRHMVTDREHRMTELFARLAAGADLETARAELFVAYGAMKREHPEVYPAKADFRVSAVRLRAASNSSRQQHGVSGERRRSPHHLCGKRIVGILRR